jgi:peptide/nickel transport system substrate-binding protein
MINNIYRGLGETQKSEISVQSPYYNKNIKGYDYNPQKAKELLLQEGFKYDSKGILLDSQGNPVRFTLITNAGNKTREAMGTQIKQDLAKIGVQVDFSPLAFNVLVDKLSNTLEWDAHIIGFTGGNEPHAPNLWYIDGNLHMFNQDSPNITGRKVSQWEKQIAALYLKGSQELDIEKRKQIYGQAQQLVEEYVPFIYLVNPYSLAAVRNRFEGIKYCALGGAFWNLEQIKPTNCQITTN